MVGIETGLGPEPTVGIPYHKQPLIQDRLIGARNAQSAGPVQATGKLWFVDLTLAGFREFFMLGCLNWHPLANLCCKPLPGGICVQNIPRDPVCPAGFSR